MLMKHGTVPCKVGKYSTGSNGCTGALPGLNNALLQRGEGEGRVDSFKGCNMHVKSHWGRQLYKLMLEAMSICQGRVYPATAIAIAADMAIRWENWHLKIPDSLSRPWSECPQASRQAHTATGSQ